MKLTRSQLKRLISESMEGVPERESFMINYLIQTIESLANATSEEIDEGLTGGFMDMHINVFKDLEKEGLIHNFDAFPKDTFYPETISLFFLYGREAAAINRALYKFFSTHPDITGHRRVDYIYTHSASGSPINNNYRSGRGNAIVTHQHSLDGLTIHISKPEHDPMKA
jgi:hypothetical protein